MTELAMSIPAWLRRWLLRRCADVVSKRPPDFVIGDDYLCRWFLIPRNPVFNIYLHLITGDDEDRALHDHPWVNASIVLRGAYVEHLPGEVRRYSGPGDVVFRRAKALHRLSLATSPVWTLFLTGPKVRTWGFQCPQGWRPWYEFVDTEDPGKVGRGCD